MGLEIERKFLLKNEGWRAECDEGVNIRQGYLNSHRARTVRVRIIGNSGVLTIKSKTQHLTRQEFEYPIPYEDALSLIALCEKPVIEKTRFKINWDGLTWEIDEFSGENEGLIVAEVELENENQPVYLPSWVGQEVSGDLRYYNSSLIANPYKNW